VNHSNVFMHYFVRFYVHISSFANGIICVFCIISAYQMLKDATDARISVEKNGDVSSLG
jgi:hypothetical protein